MLISASRLRGALPPAHRRNPINLNSRLLQVQVWSQALPTTPRCPIWTVTSVVGCKCNQILTRKNGEIRYLCCWGSPRGVQLSSDKSTRWSLRWASLMERSNKNYLRPVGGREKDCLLVVFSTARLSTLKPFGGPRTLVSDAADRTLHQKGLQIAKKVDIF